MPFLQRGLKKCEDFGDLGPISKCVRFVVKPVFLCLRARYERIRVFHVDRLAGKFYAFITCKKPFDGCRDNGKDFKDSHAPCFGTSCADYDIVIYVRLEGCLFAQNCTSIADDANT